MPDAKWPEAPLASAPKSHRIRRIAGALVGLLLLLALILVVSHLGDIEKFSELVQKAHPAWLLVAAMLQTCTYMCAAWQLYRSLRYAGERRPFIKILPLGIAKLFTDQVLPTGGVGGTLLVMKGLRRRDVPQDKAMAALMVGFIAYYLAYLTCVLTAAVLLWLKHDLGEAAWIGMIAFAVIVLTLPLSVVWLRQRSDDWEIPRYLRLPGLRPLIDLIRTAPPGFLSNPWLMLATTLTQMAIFILDAMTLWIMLKAIGQDASPSVAFIAFMMASVSATLGFIPTGLGTFEAAGVAALTLLGVSIEPALTAILLLRGFTTWLPLLPGFWLARREIRGVDGAQPFSSPQETSASQSGH